MNFRIFLTGFMGSGKSYTGRRLSEALGIPFVDLDTWIENQEGQSIQTIFEKSGEAAFRQIEREALHQMIEYGQAVIACGGGAPCFFDNMEWMNRHGITVYLQTPVDELCRRLLPEMAHRPLLKGLDEQTLPGYIGDKLALREPYYLQSQVVAPLPGALEEMLVALMRQMVTGY
ncbi:MAG: shikimate kinase [Saprospiraceae bacterium]